MIEPDSLPAPDELAASLERVVNDRKPETVYDARGLPIAVLVPVAETGTPGARQQFIQLLRAWRDEDRAAQCREWEQLEEVLAEERTPEAPA